MRILYAEAVIALKLFFRDRSAMFWSYLFPIMLLVLFISTFGSGNPKSMSGILAGVICISIMTVTLFGIGIGVAWAREEGILRSYKVTPVPKWAIIFGIIISRYIINLVSCMLLIIIARFLYNVEIRGDAFAFFIIFSLGSLTFSAIGYTIASIAKTAQSAGAMANVLFMPMILLSGATVPLLFLPEWVQNLARLIPATHLVSALQNIIVKGEGLGTSWVEMVVLSDFLLIAGLISVKFFRWE